ncbi:hypothetical protein FA10DRAFT_292383 [Acaromyces ingoldii]|uniref:Uncharacterized protein n=1 Tax=Acaromyces ingoldii TaxID=215250 RepID=A0A316YRQ2_9BASI|nr:hypothetical protein FA10DRAFT_292383 [Acaromyces ingoldii]PWN91494.1 hypothetical protein FA10DRAFT_292383 [Acaromyces ingoldii]
MEGADFCIHAPLRTSAEDMTMPKTLNSEATSTLTEQYASRGVLTKKLSIRARRMLAGNRISGESITIQISNPNTWSMPRTKKCVVARERHYNRNSATLSMPRKVCPTRQSELQGRNVGQSSTIDGSAIGSTFSDNVVFDGCNWLLNQPASASSSMSSGHATDSENGLDSVIQLYHTRSPVEPHDDLLIEDATRQSLGGAQTSPSLAAGQLESARASSEILWHQTDLATSSTCADETLLATIKKEGSEETLSPSCNSAGGGKQRLRFDLRWQGGKHQIVFDEEETQKLTYAQLLSAIDKVIARTRSVAASESLFLATGELHETASMGSSTYPDFTKLEPWKLQDTTDVRNQYPQQEPPNAQQTLVQDLISSLSRHSHPVVLLVWDGSKPPTMEQLCRLRDGPPFDLDESSDGHQTEDGEPDEAVVDNVEEQDICQGKPFKLGDFVLDPEDRGPIELRARLKNNWENDELYRKSLVAIGEVGGPSTLGEAFILNEIDQLGERTRVSHGTQSSVNRRARAHIRCFSEMLKVYAEDATCEFPISPDSSRSSTDSLCKLISPNRHHTPANAGSGDVPASTPSFDFLASSGNRAAVRPDRRPTTYDGQARFDLWTSVLGHAQLDAELETPMDAAASPNSAALFKKKSRPRVVTGNRFILNVGSTPNRSRRLHENSTRKQRGTSESILVDDIGTDKSTRREEDMPRRRERKGLPVGWDEIDENSLPVVPDAIRSLILSFPTDDAELKDESSLDELTEMRQRYQKEHEKELQKQIALKERLHAETQRQRLLPSEVMSNMRQTSQGVTTILDEVFRSAIREQRALSGISECSESFASASPSAQGFREEDREWPTRRRQTKHSDSPKGALCRAELFFGIDKRKQSKTARLEPFSISKFMENATD